MRDRATAGPGGRTGVRASGGVRWPLIRACAPPHIYINVKQHCGGHLHPLDKGVRVAWRACADDGAAAPGVVWGYPVARAWEPGPGPRYGGSGWPNRGAGFRRGALAADPGVRPPPYLHKCQTTLRRPAERSGETAVPSWNSRVAGRDGHRGLHSEVYTRL